MGGAIIMARLSARAMLKTVSGAFLLKFFIKHLILARLMVIEEKEKIKLRR